MKPVAAGVLILIAAVIALPFPVLVMAQAYPSLTTDQPLFTLRDKQVLLQGEGYTAKTQYSVWLQTPVDNSTRASGLTFTTTDKGQVPPAIFLPIEPNSPLGTYTVSISNSTESDAAIARAHYGIWGTDKYVYQRTEVVQALGGGILPKTSLKVTIRDPTAAIVYDPTIAANETGCFLTSWKVPSEAIAETYTIIIDGVGTYDSPNADFVSIAKFSVTPASLNITVHVQPEPSYERMQTASVQFAIRYPDSSGVTTMKEGLKPAALYAGQFRIADVPLTVSGTTSGMWIAQAKIPMNASLDVKYRFVLPANGYDDGNGNIGPDQDLETDAFSSVPATLLVNVAVNSTRYQVPFDSLAAYARASYQDGTAVGNATVRAWLNAGNSKINATVIQDRANSVWVVSYSFSWSDLLKLGGWKLTIEVSDTYGNAGSESLEISVEPYTLLEMVALAVIVVLVARWLLSRFWRRIYLETKRAISAIRARLRPPSFGSHFRSSPVTP